jgi:two-component sensor histidine kinase
MAERFASWWRGLARDGLPPNSVAAYVFALACVFAAMAVRALFELLDSTVLLYATYYPAILLASLAGGASAGLFATLLSLAIALWIFPSPVAMQAANIVLFLLSCFATIAVAELYRNTARRLHSEERKRTLLIRELEHRGKNTFAIVQSIVRQTLQDQKELAEVIVGRIKSVSATNDIITKSDHQTAGLQSILERELYPYGRGRIALRGPDAQLDAELARSFSLIVHELATNAAKYGALSEPSGQLSVVWSVKSGRIELDWSETNGPAVSKPVAPGFGARLVARLLKNHGGEIKPDFRPNGLRLRIVLRLAAHEPDAAQRPFSGRNRPEPEAEHGMY